MNQTTNYHNELRPVTSETSSVETVGYGQVNQHLSNVHSNQYNHSQIALNGDHQIDNQTSPSSSPKLVIIEHSASNLTVNPPAHNILNNVNNYITSFANSNDNCQNDYYKQASPPSHNSQPSTIALLYSLTNKITSNSQDEENSSKNITLNPIYQNTLDKTSSISKTENLQEEQFTTVTSNPIHDFPIQQSIRSKLETSVTEIAQSSGSHSASYNRSLIKQQHRQLNEITLHWLTQNYELRDGICLPRCLIYRHYIDFMKEYQPDSKPVGAAAFGKVISKFFAF